MSSCPLDKIHCDPLEKLFWVHRYSRADPVTFEPVCGSFVVYRMEHIIPPILMYACSVVISCIDLIDPIIIWVLRKEWYKLVLEGLTSVWIFPVVVVMVAAVIANSRLTLNPLFMETENTESSDLKPRIMSSDKGASTTSSSVVSDVKFAEEKITTNTAAGSEPGVDPTTDAASIYKAKKDDIILRTGCSKLAARKALQRTGNVDEIVNNIMNGDRYEYMSDSDADDHPSDNEADEPREPELPKFIHSVTEFIRTGADLNAIDAPKLTLFHHPAEFMASETATHSIGNLGLKWEFMYEFKDGHRITREEFHDVIRGAFQTAKHAWIDACAARELTIMDRVFLPREKQEEEKEDQQKPIWLCSDDDCTRHAMCMQVRTAMHKEHGCEIAFGTIIEDPINEEIEAREKASQMKEENAALQKC